MKKVIKHKFLHINFFYHFITLIKFINLKVKAVLFSYLMILKNFMHNCHNTSLKNIISSSKFRSQIFNKHNLSEKNSKLSKQLLGSNINKTTSYILPKEEIYNSNYNNSYSSEMNK